MALEWHPPKSWTKRRLNSRIVRTEKACLHAVCLAPHDVAALLLSISQLWIRGAYDTEREQKPLSTCWPDIYTAGQDPMHTCGSKNTALIFFCGDSCKISSA